MPFYFQSSSHNKKRRQKLLLAGSFVGGGNAGDAAALISVQQLLEELELPVAVEILSSSSNILLNFDNYYYLEELNEALVKYLIQDMPLLLVLGGGSLFGSSTVPKLQVFIEQAKIKTALFCIGTDFSTVSQFNKNRQQLRRLLENSCHLSTRSSFSQDICRKIGVEPSEPYPLGDIVHLLETMPSFLSLKTKDEFTVGVSLCSNWEDEHLVTYMAEILDGLVRSKGKAKIIFFPFDLRSKHDVLTHQKVIEHMEHKDRTLLIQKYIYPPQLQDVFSQLDLIIGMRLHANIMAYNVGIPHIAINYHPKIKSFMEWIGLPDQFLLEGNPAVDWVYGYGPPLFYPSMDEAMAKIELALHRSPLLSPQTQKKNIRDKLCQLLKNNFV